MVLQDQRGSQSTVKDKVLFRILNSYFIKICTYDHYSHEQAFDIIIHQKVLDLHRNEIVGEENFPSPC